MRSTRRDRALPRMHPIGLAVLMALAGPAGALPQGATVVNGQVTVATPSPTLQVITQGSARGIVDWSSFSIAAGEKVRIDQPSSSAVLLNRVTGQDPSQIFGQLQSNGRIFLLNPYGVVFGASARVDVGGLVASSLSLSNADFLAGRYALTSLDPNAPPQRGEVRNEGTIVAPGGFVGLAGPQVANTGSIEATQGRVGLAAAQQVLVDVEGDGLIFFQTSASEAGNRLAQLGRIQADGGSVELRAAARGGFADTVLNMGGVVQARGLGLRAGRVVIDGGDAGITRVAGSVDTSSAQRGGHVEVTGEKVLLDAGAVLDASGARGGGTVLVGGNWQGQGPQRNARQTHVDGQARIDVSASGEGDGGTAVVWADDTTRFYGRIAARGGEQGGDGGRVEVSGKRHLAFAGSVDARSAAGQRGVLLLDPSNIRITDSDVDISPTAPFVGSEDTSQLSAATLVAAVNTANVTVDATGGAGGAGTPGISVESDVAWNSGFTLTLKASGTIAVGAAISNAGSGGLNLFTDGAVTGDGAIDLSGGGFTVSGTDGPGNRAASYSGATIDTAGAGVAGGAVNIATDGAISTGTVTTTGGNSTGATPGHAGGAVTLTAGNGNITTGAIDTRGGNAGTSLVAFAGGAAGNVAVAIDVPSAARQITLGTLTATGGTGSSSLVGDVDGGIGGAGGSVTVTNANGNVSAGIIGTSGGAGGDGHGNGSGGNGGAARDVAITAATGAVQVGTITATGGAVGDGDSPTLGARADITLDAGTNLTLTGALNAGSGSGASTITLGFGQAGSGGTLDLTSAGTLSGNTIAAAGGASASGDTLRATSNAATITLGANSLQLDASTSIGLTAVDTVDLTGGAGANTFVAGAWGGRLTVRASAGGDTVQGNGSDTTFVGRNTGTAYTITAANTGSGGGTTLTSVGHITGGTGNDSFVFEATGSLDGVAGGGGSNTLDLSAKTGAVAIDAGAGTATGVGAFTGISTLVGNDGSTGANTTLTGPDGTRTFAVSSTNAGSVGGIAFSGVGNLVGGNGANTFALASGGSLAGSVTGDGNDTLDLSARTGAVAIDLAAGTATGTGGFSGISTLIGNDGGTGSNTTLTGANTGQTFTLNAANAGSLSGGVGFSGIGNLTGGTAANSFVFGSAGSLAGNLAGGAAGDTLDLSAKSGAITVNLQTAKSTGIGGTFSGIDTLVGNQGPAGNSTALIGSDAGIAFTLAGAGAGTAGGLGFSGVTSLTGGSGADSFGGNGSLAGSLADGGGTTTLFGTLATGGAQTWDGAVTLSAATSLASSGGGALRFNGTVDGNQTLALSSAGSITFGAGVGGVTPLAGLSASAGTRLERAQALVVGAPASLSVGGTAVDTTLRDYFGSGAASAVQIDAGGGGTHDLTASGAGVLPTLVVSGDLSVGAGAALSQSGALSVAGTTQVIGGANAITLDNAGNQLTGAVSLSNSGANDVVLVNGRATQLGPVAAGAGSVTISSAGALTQTGAITQAGTGAVSLAAGAEVITLTNAGNDFGGAVALSGSTVQIRDQNDLTLADSSVGALVVIANGAITQSGALTVAGASSFAAGAGSIALQSAGNSFGGGVALSSTGAGGVALFDSGALLLSNVTVGSGTLQLAAGGAITQSGVVTQAGAGAVILDAGTNAVTLTAAGNNFQGPVAVTGGAVALMDLNALTLAASTLGSLTVDTNGAIGQTGVLNVSGASTFDAGNGSITLLAANSFGSGVALANTGASNVALNSAGALQINGAALGSGSFAVTSGGAVTQAGAIVQAGGAGAVSVDAGANAITLDHAGNDFTGAVGLSNSGANAVALRDANALALGTLTLGSGTLTLTSAGSLTQAGAITQAPGGQAVTIAAGTGNVVLDQAGNEFQGALTVSGGAISLRDASDLTVSVTPAADASVSLVAAGNLTLPSADLDTGSGDLSLSFATLGAGLGTLHGRNVSLAGSGGMALGHVTADGTLALSSADAAITQQAGTAVLAAGATTIDAGSGDVVLANAGNDFAGVAVSGGALSLRDQNALNVTALASGANRSVSLVAGGALSTPAAAIDTGTADLVLSSGAALTTPGSLSGANLSLTGAAGLAIGSSLAASGTLSLQTTNAAITQSGGAIGVAGTSSIDAGSGAVTLVQAGNDFGGAVAVTGGAVSLRDQNALTLSALNNGANQDLSLAAGGVLTLPLAGIDTGSADLSLSFATLGAGLGTLHGRNVSLAGSGGMALGHVTADGTLALSSTNAAITQQAGTAVLAAGATTIDAGSGDVVLANAGNDFAGVAVSGGALSLRDQNALNVTALASGANRSVSLVAGGALSTPAAAIDTGTADLVLSSGAALTTPGSLSGANLSLTGAAGLAIGSSLAASGTLSLQTTNAAITQSGGAIGVAGTSSIDAGSGAVTLVQAGNDFGGAVAVTGGAVSLRDQNALTLGAVQAASLGVTTSNGAVAQTAAATVSGDTNVDAGTGAVTLTQAANRFARVAVSGGAVAISQAGALELGATAAASLVVTTGGEITQSAAVRVGGASVLDAGTANITLSHASNDFGSVALAGGALALADANDLAVTSLAAGVNRSVSLVAGGTLSLPLGDISTGSAALVLASNGGQLATRGAVSGQGVALTGSAGIVLGGDVRSATDQTYATAVTLAADATLDAGAGRVLLQSGLAGAGHDLTVASSAAVDGNVAGTGHQTWSGRLTLTGDATLDSGAGRIVLADGVQTGVHALTVASDTTLGGDVSGTGHQTFGAALRLSNDVALSSDGGRIALLGTVDGGGQTLTLSSSAAAADAVRTGAALGNLSALTVDGRATLGGDVTTSGAQRFNGGVTLAADTTLDAGAGTIALQDGIDGGGHRLGLASSHAAPDAIRSAGPIADAAALTVDGNIALGRGVATSGAQVYGAALRLDADVTLEGSSLRFAGTVDGTRALTVRSADTRFGAAVGGSTALASLLSEGAGSTHIGGPITTTGMQTYANAVNLDADVRLAGSTLRFDGRIDGAHALTIEGGGATTIFNAAVGQSSPLASLAVTGPTTLAGGLIATNGAQRYDGAVTLGADTQLSGGTLALNGTLDGPHALALQFGGTSTLGGTVGGGTPLASLSSTGAVVLGAGAVTTSGAQSYGSTLRLAGDTALRGSALSFAGAVSGARDLLLEADGLAAGAITGSGTLHIAPRSVDRSIGIAGGAGDLQISSTLIGSAGGFASHVFGRSDGTGSVTVGAWDLAAHSTLQSGSGELHLAGRVDGGFDLALNTGGTTRIGGPVGTTSALRSLSIDNHAGAADWNGSSGEHTRLEGAGGSAHIVTTGAQTYAEALQADVAVQLAGGAIVAEQAGNRFTAPVSAAAGSLVLRSADGLTLGTLTLADGGRIESDGVLRLAGALQLNGGTLSLVSNATPTALAFTDPALQTGDPLTFGFTPLREASATIVQEAGATLSSAPGSLLVLRSPNSGSILLDRAGNALRGEISAVSGPLGDDSAARFTGNQIVLGFVRIASSEIHAAGAPPAAGEPDPLRAGIEGDVLKLSADQLTTGPDGLLRARLPFLDSQGSQTSLPGLTLVMSPQALTIGGGFGTPSADGFIRVRVGSELGGYLTVRPKGAGGENAVILLAGPDPKPFYDGSGKLSEVRVFYNGDAPRTPQETGALTAVTAIVEDARTTRFEEAVRTENVKSRLRSGVIAEVGSGRPATVGRESIRLPENCAVKADSLQCE